MRKRQLIQAGVRPAALERGRIFSRSRNQEATTQRSNWYSIVRNEATDTAEIMIYDEIGYWGTTAAEFVRELGRVDAKTIQLRLSSPGGEVYDGIAIYNALLDHPAHVKVGIDGLAASIASVIAMAGDEIDMAPTAEMMIHDAWGITIGDAAEHELAVTDLHRVSDNISNVYALRAGGEAGEWRTRMRAETWYSATEAKAAGLIDEVRGKKVEESTQDRWDLTMYNYAGREYAPAPVQPGPTFEFDLDGLKSVLKGAFA